MSRRRETFEVAEPARLVVRLQAGRVEVTEGAPGLVAVTVDGPLADGFVVEQSGPVVTVRQQDARWGGSGFHNLTVEAPAGTSVDASLASADLTASMPVGDLTVKVASGQVRAGRVGGDLDVKTASGDLLVEQVVGRLRVASASGDVRIGAVGGSAVCTTASGDVSVGSATGDLEVKTASGDASVQRFEGSEFRAKTVSGDARLHLPSGRTVEVDAHTLTGEVRLPKPLEDQPSPSLDPNRRRVRLVFHSVSGDLEVVPG
ncbi:MAG: DUF4097 family beta strand repeat-containing protein [Acidimicrobiia bacterium]